jgi:hypothetical protein
MELERTTGEALDRIQLLALVHDAHFEAHATREWRDSASDVPSPEDGEPRSGQNGFDKDDHCPSAAHPKILSEVPREQLRRSAALRLSKRREHRVLDRAAADSAQRAPIWPQ